MCIFFYEARKNWKQGFVDSGFWHVDKRERETAANELLSTLLSVVANRNLVNLQRDASTSLNHVCSYYRQEMDFAFRASHSTVVRW